MVEAVAPARASEGRVRPDLAALLAELQRELRLQDWRIDVSYVPNLTNRAGYPVHGLCSHLVDAKVASIAIRDPETPATADDPSVEETLVHELVHLHFAPFSGSSSAEIAAEEQAVWALTEALHAAKTEARRGQIARAMRARASVHMQQKQEGSAMPEPTKTKERASMCDPAVIDAILALIESDPEAAKAYLQKLKGSAEDPGADAGDMPPPLPPGEQGPPPVPPKDDQLAQAPPPPKDEPKAQRATVSRAEFDQLKVEQLVHRHGAALNDKQRAFALGLSPSQVVAYIATQTSGGAAPASANAAAERSQGAAPTIVTRVEFDRFRVDQVLALHGAHLTEAQRKFAASLPAEQVRGYLALHPAPEGTAPVQRNQSPTKGGPAGAAPQSAPSERDARRARLGLSSGASPIVKVGNVLQLGPMTREQAIAWRSQKGAAR
jgi:hypothetical protein